MFKGRKKELEILESRFSSSRKEFGVIYGRRRIGKTELILHFMEKKDGLIFQAKRTSAYGNLKSFSYALNKLTGMPLSFVYSNYEEAFDSLKNYVKNNRFILAIDEYPYILEQDSSFSSVIQEFIDYAPDNIMMILSGSDVSFLKNEINNHNSPLYKRRTFEIELKKMPFDEMKEFVKDFPFEERCNFLSFMSSYPYYLSAINQTISFEENMIQLIFNQYGTFFTLPDQLLSNSTNKQDIYNAILEAIAHRKRHIKEIAEYTHEDSAKISKYIATLLNGEILIRKEMFEGNQKSNYYEISDPLLRFWYTFIYGNEERIRINGRLVYQELKGQIYNFLCKGMEEVALSYIELLNSQGKLKHIFKPLKEYKVEKSKIGRSIEIDGLSRIENHLLVVECKFRNKPFTSSMMEHLVESASVFPNKLEKEYYIFSKSGFEIEPSEHIHLIDFKDII